MRSQVPHRQIRATQTETTLTVYQAYSPQIADPALRAGRFVPPFKRDRMTWIKPSFLWMMYRSGWATKQRQERVLAIEITRAGFEWALTRSVLSHFEPGTYRDASAWRERKAEAPVRVQWDPERDLKLTPLPYRAIQVGLSREAVRRYVDEWTVGMTDVTPLARRVADLVAARRFDAAAKELPQEHPYPLSPDLRRVVGAD